MKRRGRAPTAGPQPGYASAGHAETGTPQPGTPKQSCRLFTPSVQGVLIERPNRFLIVAGTAAGRLTAHCPNPGRLQELLPGQKIILERRVPSSRSAASTPRKTRYSLVAAHYRNRIVPLEAGRANTVAEQLLIPALFPGYRDLRRKVTRGDVRFDFGLTIDDGPLLLEVKACTLVEQETALFPDAPTARGVKHMDRLMCCAGRKALLFVIMQPQAAVFMPNIHTDPRFSRKLMEYAGALEIYASSVSTDARGNVALANLSVPVELGRAQKHLSRGGVYLLVLEMPISRSIRVGSLGACRLDKGYYVYVGSAMAGLDSRIKRHHRRRKRLRWHIDYLTRYAGRIVDFPIRTTHRLECNLAGDLGRIADDRLQGFGCSDCRCNSHLFFFAAQPMHDRRFIDLVGRYRHFEALL